MKNENLYLKRTLREEYQKLLNELIVAGSKKKDDEIAPVQMSALPTELAQRKYVPLTPGTQGHTDFQKMLQLKKQEAKKYQQELELGTEMRRQGQPGYYEPVGDKYYFQGTQPWADEPSQHHWRTHADIMKAKPAWEHVGPIEPHPGTYAAGEEYARKGKVHAEPYIVSGRGTEAHETRRRARDPRYGGDESIFSTIGRYIPVPAGAAVTGDPTFSVTDAMSALFGSDPPRTSFSGPEWDPCLHKTKEGVCLAGYKRPTEVMDLSPTDLEIKDAIRKANATEALKAEPDYEEAAKRAEYFLAKQVKAKLHNFEAASERAQEVFRETAVPSDHLFEALPGDYFASAPFSRGPEHSFMANVMNAIGRSYCTAAGMPSSPLPDCGVEGWPNPEKELNEKVINDLHEQEKELRPGVDSDTSKIIQAQNNINEYMKFGTPGAKEAGTFDYMHSGNTALHPFSAAEIKEFGNKVHEAEKALSPIIQNMLIRHQGNVESTLEAVLMHQAYAQLGLPDKGKVPEPLTEAETDAWNAYIKVQEQLQKKRKIFMYKLNMIAERTELPTHKEISTGGQLDWAGRAEYGFGNERPAHGTNKEESEGLGYRAAVLYEANAAKARLAGGPSEQWERGFYDASGYFNFTLLGLIEVGLLPTPWGLPGLVRPFVGLGKVAAAGAVGRRAIAGGKTAESVSALRAGLPKWQQRILSNRETAAFFANRERAFALTGESTPLNQPGFWNPLYWPKNLRKAAPEQWRQFLTGKTTSEQRAARDAWATTDRAGYGTPENPASGRPYDAWHGARTGPTPAEFAAREQMYADLTIPANTSTKDAVRKILDNTQKLEAWAAAKYGAEVAGHRGTGHIEDILKTALALTKAEGGTPLIVSLEAMKDILQQMVRGKANPLMQLHESKIKHIIKEEYQKLLQEQSGGSALTRIGKTAFYLDELGNLRKFQVPFKSPMPMGGFAPLAGLGQETNLLTRSLSREIPGLGQDAKFSQERLQQAIDKLRAETARQTRVQEITPGPGATHVEPHGFGAEYLGTREAPGEAIDPSALQKQIADYIKTKTGQTDAGAVPRTQHGAMTQDFPYEELAPSGVRDILKNVIEDVRAGVISPSDAAGHVVEYHLPDAQRFLQIRAREAARQQEIENMAQGMASGTHKRQVEMGTPAEENARYVIRQAAIERSKEIEAAQAAHRRRTFPTPGSMYPIRDITAGQERLEQTREVAGANRAYTQAYNHAIDRTGTYDEFLKRQGESIVGPGKALEKAIGKHEAQYVATLYSDPGFKYEGFIPTQYDEIKSFMTKYGVEKYNQLYGAIPGVNAPKDLIKAFMDTGLGPMHDGAPVASRQFDNDMYLKDFNTYRDLRRRARLQRQAGEEPVAEDYTGFPDEDSVFDDDGNLIGTRGRIDPAQYGLETGVGQTSSHRGDLRAQRRADYLAAEPERTRTAEQLRGFETDNDYETFARTFDPTSVIEEIMPHTIESGYPRKHPGDPEANWRNVGYTKTQRDNVLALVSHLSNSRGGMPLRPLNELERELAIARYGRYFDKIYIHMKNYDPAFMFMTEKVLSPSAMRAELAADAPGMNTVLRVATGRSPRRAMSSDRDFRGRDYSPLDLAEFFLETTDYMTGQGVRGMGVGRALKAYEMLAGPRSEGSKVQALRSIALLLGAQEPWEITAQIKEVEEVISNAIARIRQDPTNAKILEDLIERGELRQMLDEFDRANQHPQALGIVRDPRYSQPDVITKESDPRRSSKLEIPTDEEIAIQARKSELERLIRSTYFDPRGGKQAVMGSEQRAEYHKLPPDEAKAKREADRAGWQAELDALKSPGAPPKINPRFRKLELDESLIKKVLKEEYKKLLQERRNTIYN